MVVSCGLVRVTREGFVITAAVELKAVPESGRSFLSSLASRSSCFTDLRDEPELYPLSGFVISEYRVFP